MDYGRSAIRHRGPTSKQGHSGSRHEAQRRRGEGHLNGGDWKPVVEHIEV